MKQTNSEMVSVSESREKMWLSKDLEHAVDLSDSAGDLGPLMPPQPVLSRTLVWDQGAKPPEIFLLLALQKLLKKTAFITYISPTMTQWRLVGEKWLKWRAQLQHSDHIVKSISILNMKFSSHDFNHKTWSTW